MFNIIIGLATRYGTWSPSGTIHIHNGLTKKDDFHHCYRNLLQNITGNSEKYEEGLESREMGLFLIYVEVFNFLGRKVNTKRKDLQDALIAVMEINILENINLETYK
jgi:hypothetical protein